MKYAKYISDIEVRIPSQDDWIEWTRHMRLRIRRSMGWCRYGRQLFPGLHRISAGVSGSHVHPASQRQRTRSLRSGMETMI